MAVIRHIIITKGYLLNEITQIEMVDANRHIIFRVLFTGNLCCRVRDNARSSVPGLPGHTPG